MTAVARAFWGSCWLGVNGRVVCGPSVLDAWSGLHRQRWRVANLDNAVEIARSDSGLMCARRATGQLACWGTNVDGLLTAGDHLDAPRTFRLDTLIARAR